MNLFRVDQNKKYKTQDILRQLDKRAGNCLEFEPGSNNLNFLSLTNNSEDGNPFDEEDMNALDLEVKSMLLRDQKIKISTDPGFYSRQGIKLEEPSKIMIWEFLRGIAGDYKAQLLATEDEIRQRIPKDLPLLLGWMSGITMIWRMRKCQARMKLFK